MAQQPASDLAVRGITAGARLQGSVNDLGSVTRLDATGGYVFNRNWSVEAGVPFYFVRPSGSIASGTGAIDTNALGNVYLQTLFRRPGETWGYASLLTVSAPTGDKDAGLTTGHVTADWTNHVEYYAGRLTPFGSAGIANAVSDTMIFIRPYTSLGFTSHFDGGTRLRVTRALETGASGYVIVPSGGQTVYSRVAAPVRQPPVLPTRAVGRARRGVFEENSVTTGPAEIARDHGLSAWTRVAPYSTFDLCGGYSRSVRFGLDTVFFGIEFNVRRLVNSGRP